MFLPHLSLAFLLAACSSEPAAPASVPAVAADVAAPPAFDPGVTVPRCPAPSVIETQSALAAAGVSTALADLIAERTFDVNSANKDKIAVRTGVVIADLLLTAAITPKERLLAQLDQINTGLAKIDGGADIAFTINDLQERVRADAVTRADLLKELSELSIVAIPELEFNGQKRIVPLIQAGSWLEGANLVSKAVKAAGKPDAADSVLKQPAVVDYFITYVATDGKDKAPEAVTQKLNESLQALKVLAEKKEALTSEEIDSATRVTDDVLSLL